MRHGEPLTLQVLRGGIWQDFATGDLVRVVKHIEENPPGVWRAVTWRGAVVVKPRDVEQYLALNGHVMMAPRFVREDAAGLPVYDTPEHNPNCPCGRDS